MIRRAALRLVLFALALSATSAPHRLLRAQASLQADAASLVRACFERYNTSWYRSLTFIQHTIRYGSDGAGDTAIWYEAYEAPGRLRIDVAPLDRRTMFLFAGDTQYVFQRDTLISARRLVHPLLLLGFDLYFLPPEVTLAKLEEIGFDARIVRRDVWQGRPAVVVGASQNDTTSAQFWIDAERLVFVRMLMPLSGRQQEVQFNRYERLGDGWIAPEVIVAVDGQVVMKELYSEIRAGTSFDTNFFDPGQWRTARHWLP